MDIEVTQRQYYGRASQLDKLKHDMTDYKLSYKSRHAAAKAFAKIVAQCNDSQLMELRQRLIRASQAGDRDAAGKYSYLIKRYLGEDAESGTYDR